MHMTIPIKYLYTHYVCIHICLAWEKGPYLGTPRYKIPKRLARRVCRRLNDSTLLRRAWRFWWTEVGAIFLGPWSGPPQMMIIMVMVLYDLIPGSLQEDMLIFVVKKEKKKKRPSLSEVGKCNLEDHSGTYLTCHMSCFMRSFRISRPNLWLGDFFFPDLVEKASARMLSKAKNMEVSTFLRLPAFWPSLQTFESVKTRWTSKVKKNGGFLLRCFFCAAKLACVFLLKWTKPTKLNE